MSSQTTRGKEYSQRAGTVYLAFELGNTEWKLAFTVGLGQKPRERTIPLVRLDGWRRRSSGRSSGLAWPVRPEW